MKRQKKRKRTEEEIRKINDRNKEKRCRRRLLEYFDKGDILATWTYEPQKRPEDMKTALKDFQKAIRRVRKEYKARGQELFWIRNIERGTKGAWHIHLVVNEIGDAASILEKAWEHGGTWAQEIGKSEKLHDANFGKLAAYITKNEHTTEEKKDGTPGKPRIKESNYGTSKNMPIPEPKKDKLIRWKEEVKPKKGYRIIQSHEGINPVTGYKYRQYTMIREERSRGSSPRGNCAGAKYQKKYKYCCHR